MFGINQVIIVGTVAADPDVNVYNDKKKVNLFLAINEKEPRVNKETGELEWQDVTRWAVAEFWGGQAGFIEKYVTKGDNVAIQGKFARSSWDDKETGVKKYKTIIEGNNVNLLTSSKPSKKEIAKAVIAYLESLEAKGINLQTGIAELKAIVEASENLAAQPF